MKTALGFLAVVLALSLAVMLVMAADLKRANRELAEENARLIGNLRRERQSADDWEKAYGRAHNQCMRLLKLVGESR